MSPVFTTAEVAARYRRKPMTVRAWVRAGKLRPIAGTSGRGQMIFTEAELKRFEEKLKPIEAY